MNNSKRRVIVLFIVMLISIPVFAGVPLTIIQKVYYLLGKYEENASNSKTLKEEINSYFALDSMAKKAIRDHWTNFSIRQKEEYMSLMNQLLEKVVYEDTKENIRKGKVRFAGERISRKRAKVMTRIYIPSEDIEVENDFIMRKTNGWKIYDIHIDGASLVEDYRSQFNKIVMDNGIDENDKSLIPRLKRAVSEEKTKWQYNNKKRQNRRTKKRRNINRGSLLEDL